MLSNGFDGIQSAFSDVGVLLVGELFLEGYDGSADTLVSIILFGF